MPYGSQTSWTMMSSTILASCYLSLLWYVSFLFSFISFFSFALLYMMIFKWNTYVKLALLLVLLLTLLIYLGQSMPAIPMTSLGSIWWVTTQMSYYPFPEGTRVISSLPLLAMSFLFFSYIPQSLVLTMSSY